MSDLGLAITKLGSAISDTSMINAGADLAYMAEHQRVMDDCVGVPTVPF